MPPRRPESLDTLLRIRKRQEDLRAQDLAATQREIQRAARERAKLILEKRRLLNAADQAQRDALDASSLRRYYQYERYLARRTDEKDAELRDLQATAAAKRVQLDRAIQKRRMIDTLRETRAGNYAEYVRREEQKQTDEIAAMRSGARARRQEKSE